MRKFFSIAILALLASCTQIEQETPMTPEQVDQTIATKASGFSSAYGIDWSSITSSTNSSSTYKALKKIKITSDADYIYFYIEANPSYMCRDHHYDCRFRFYKYNSSGSTGYWGSNTYSEIDSGHDKFAVKDGNICFHVYGSSAYSANVYAGSSTWYYEIRMDRSLDSYLQGSGTKKFGVALDATAVDDDDNWTNTNNWAPYGVIPTYGSSLYTFGSGGGSSLSLSFTECSGEVANPERGMMSYSEFLFDGGVPSVKNIPVNYTGESLAFLLFYLKDYMNSSISSSALQYIRTELGKVRERNMKAVVRFAYSKTYSDDEPQEPEPSRILSHVNQLASIMSDYADIIYCVQAGWLGTYGEWYYKTNNHDNSVSGRSDYYLYYTDEENHPGVIYDMNENHEELVEAVLNAVPYPIHVGLRTAFYKRYVMNLDDPDYWSEITHWPSSSSSAKKYRLSFYNDGIRGSSSDVGTFHDQTDYDMWYQQGNWLVCGGEMSYRSQSTFDGLSDDLKNCDLSIAAMRQQHISYLHYSTSNRFMAKWIAEGRMEDLKKFQGYRLVLGNVNLNYSSLSSGSSVSYTIRIKNTGCAPVIYERPFKLVLLDGSTRRVLADLGEVRDIFPEEGYTTISGSFTWPVSVSSGDRLAIWLPDRASDLQSTSAYSIHLANNEVTWTSGYNVLHTF